MWDDIAEADHNLFLVHGLTQISRRTSGSSRRRRFPFPRTHDDQVLATLKRWFRTFVDQRHLGAAERILLTLHDRDCGKETLADFVFTAATDFYFTGDGHALDFANKMFEGARLCGMGRRTRDPPPDRCRFGEPHPPRRNLALGRQPAGLRKHILAPRRNLGGQSAQRSHPRHLRLHPSHARRRL